MRSVHFVVMGTISANIQILWAVVLTIPVDVVNDLSPVQWPSEQLLNYQDVLCHPRPFAFENLHHYIAVVTYPTGPNRHPLALCQPS